LKNAGEDIRDRIWTAHPENKKTLTDPDMGSLLYCAGLDAARAYVLPVADAEVSAPVTEVIVGRSASQVMAPSSNWKGYLKLSLVSASIAIYPATSAAEKVSFNTLNRATGNRRKMVDSVTGDVVESDEQVKGYAVAKDQYVMVEADELAEIAIESSHTVDIEKFVPKASIDDGYRDTPYYLAPEDQVGQEAFAVIRDAMKKKKMVGIARVVMARRERVMMLEPFGKGLMGTTLLYSYEIRGEDAAFEDIPDIKLPEQMVKLAEDIIDRMTGEFEPDKIEDRYEQAMIELPACLPAPKEKVTARPANVVNLMEALRRSVEGSTSKAGVSAKKAEIA
jgi:DNA end-binding protein Ku